MNPHPKPPVRSKRKKALTLRERKARRPASFCVEKSCRAVPHHIGRCTTHAKLHLDKLQRADVVRPGVECEAAAWHADLFPCGGGIQVNHGIERELLLTRWLRENVLPGCRDLNLWAYRHRRLWDQMLMDWWGVEKFERLRRLSISGARPDYESVLADLTERLKVSNVA